MLTSAQSIAQLYIAYFNRAGEPEGMAFWVEVLESGALTLSEIAADFATQSEATALYPFLEDRFSQSPGDFLTSVYQNLFDREPDLDGLLFWADVIAAGGNLGDILLLIIEGASADDQRVLDAKIAAATQWTEGASGIEGFVLTEDARLSSQEALELANPDLNAPDAAASFIEGYFQAAPSVTLTPVDQGISTINNLFASAKVADITVTQDETLGAATLGLEGADAVRFEIVEGALILKQGAILAFGDDDALRVTVTVDEEGSGYNLTSGPEAGAGLKLDLEEVDVVGPSLLEDVEPLTDDFLVNELTENGQLNASVAALNNGNWVVTWESSDLQLDDTSSRAINARIFEPNGNPITDDFLVNEIPDGTQQRPEVAALADGGFVVVWQSDDGTLGDTSQGAINARIFDSDGDPVTDDFLVNEKTQDSQRNPDVEALPDDGFIVAWQTGNNELGDTSGNGVSARIFDGDGDPVTGDFLVNENILSEQFEASVAVISDDSFVVAFGSSDNSLGDEINNGSAIYARIFDFDGDPQTPDFRVNEFIQGNQQSPYVEGLGDGNFVVAWTSPDALLGSATDDEVSGRIFDEDGDPVTDEFLVNELVGGSQARPSIAALNEGGFVVTWQSADKSIGDDDSLDIYGRIFDPDGDPLTDDLLINEKVVNNQFVPSVAALRDGGFAAAWQSFDREFDDLSGSAITGAVFDVETGTTTTTDVQITAALDPSGDFGFDPVEAVGQSADPGSEIIA